MMEIKMPSNCVNCTAEEMEYDGSGPNWKKVAEIAGIVVSAAIMITSATLMFKKGYNPDSSPVDPGVLNGFGKKMLGTFFVGFGGAVASVECLTSKDLND